MSIDTIYSILSTLLLLVYWITMVGVTLRILMQRKPTSYVIAWLVIIYLIPIIGLLCYFLFGENTLGRKRNERINNIWHSVYPWLKKLEKDYDIFAKENSSVAEPLFQLCKYRSGIKGIRGNLIDLYTDADAVFDQIIIDINQAKESIEMEFYIWMVNGKITEITEALIAAANRGISCRIILDSAGSRKFFKSHYPKLMRNANIQLVEALKVNLFRIPFRRLDIRQHRKMILIDNITAYTGSLNMVDPKYFKQGLGVGEWIDIMIRIEGPVTSLMRMIFTCDWEIETGNRILPPAPENCPLPYVQGHTLQMIASGPSFNEEIILECLLIAIYSARQSLIMTTPYFVPSDDLLHAICAAARRGVDVRIIIPVKNDSIMVKWASRAFFNELLSAGVKIYEFDGGLLHTKSVLIDNELSLIGSVNLDMRSLWLNFEITAVIDDKDFGTALRKLQHEYFNKSTLLNVDKWLKRPLWQQITERLFYFFAPLL